MVRRHPVTGEEFGQHIELKKDPFTDKTAAAQRKETMKACPCFLCFICLNPPKTFGEWESWGFDRIGQESVRLWKRY